MNFNSAEIMMTVFVRKRFEKQFFRLMIRINNSDFKRVSKYCIQLYLIKISPEEKFSGDDF